MKRGAVAAACVAAALGPAPLAADLSQTPRAALTRLSQAVSAQILGASPEPPVAVQVAGESAELARDFAAPLLSELALRSLGPLPLSAASFEAAELDARERGARSLARLTVSLRGGLLQARGDLVSTWVNFWSGRARTRSARPSAVLFASVEADAQALLLAASAPSRAVGQLQLEGAKLADLPRWTSALAAGDLDGDGRDEIVALTDEEVLAFSAEGRLLARRDHRMLGDSPTPCREPFGAVWVQGQRVSYFSAARKTGELLAFDPARREFVALGSLSEVPVATDGVTQLWGSFVPGQSAFASEVRSSSGERWSLRGPLWTVSLFRAPTKLQSLVAFADGSASWAEESGHRRARPIRQGAAGMTLIDLDGDGEPELVTTSPAYHPDAEEVRVLELGGTPSPSSSASEPATAVPDARRRAAVRGGWALQVVGARLGPEKGAQIVVGVWKPDGSGELQVFRQVPR